MFLIKLNLNNLHQIFLHLLTHSYVFYCIYTVHILYCLLLLLVLLWNTKERLRRMFTVFTMSEYIQYTGINIIVFCGKAVDMLKSC